MGAVDEIGLAGRPATVASLTADLRALGLGEGGVVVVHSSLSRLGYVSGGAHAVVLALLEAVGPEGTVVVPTHSTDLSDPCRWVAPPVPEDWWDTIRSTMPAFDPELTPTRRMGAIPEVFRRLPQAVRSRHPMYSMAAHGPAAEDIVADHPLPFGLGESSPLGRLYEHDARVLLLGVTHANDTSLHLAEARAAFPAKVVIRQASPVWMHGERWWASYDDLDPDAEDFEQLGEDFSATGRERQGPVGAGLGRLCRQREIVDFGVTWLERHRA